MEGNPRPTESSSDVKFEIGHVLFIDIVGYSKLLITEQSKLLQKLKEIVRGAEQVRFSEAEGKLLRLPTGDGGALVFGNSPRSSQNAPTTTVHSRWPYGFDPAAQDRSSVGSDSKRSRLPAPSHRQRESRPNK